MLHAAELLLETNCRRTRATTGLGRGARCHPATAQGPAFAERRAVADLDRHASTVLIQLHPERVRFVEIERIIFGIVRSKDGHRFTRGQHMTPHVALRTQMLPRSQYSLERLLPIPDRLSIHPYNDIPDNRRSDSFVSEGKVNVGRIAAVEFKDGPHRGTHLLALHVGGISGNTQSTESDKGRDDCVISAGATRLRLFRHDADLIADWVCVNQARPSQIGRQFLRPGLALPDALGKRERLTLVFPKNFLAALVECVAVAVLHALEQLLH